MIRGTELNRWRTPTVYIMLLFCQTIGFSSATFLPSKGVSLGLLGFMIFYFILLIIFGIPLFYMELVIGQFSGRNCVDVWFVRPFLKRVGYVTVLWQISIVVYNLIMASYQLHYILISFQDPPPFTICGSWSNKLCDSIVNNHTIYKGCLQAPVPLPYCSMIAKTFPESQYFREYLYNHPKYSFQMNKQLCVSAFIVCFLLFLSCFKREESFRRFLGIITFLPVVGHFLLMMGSLVQRGILTKFYDALDTDFSVFINQFRISNVFQQASNTLNIGSGIPITLASSASFRTPCYTAAVVTVVASAAFNVMIMFTAAMMVCPLSEELGIDAHRAMGYNLNVPFERFPLFLDHYDSKLWLIIAFISNGVLAMRIIVIIMFNFLETIATKSEKLARHMELVCLLTVSILYLVTIPLLSNVGMGAFLKIHKTFLSLIPLAIAVLECVVFLHWYGINKFSEDIHFMLGCPPPLFVKVFWTFSCVLSMLGFGGEFSHFLSDVKWRRVWNFKDITDLVGLFLISVFFGYLFFMTVVVLVWAAYKKKFKEMTNLDPTWGPKNPILLRSRAMFTGHAMTKEYMYRQYHLQAGILERQKRANLRKFIEERKSAPYTT